jgi:primosomal protein N' (replication factor Y) (superfamily II helicase)
MTGYCEVALPVPLDRTFTYALRLGQIAQRGVRVIAPFRNEKLIGVVTAITTIPPADVEVKSLEAVLDDEPLLSEQLLSLAEWMAGYYLAPLGEVLRGMLPLMAEVQRTVYYRITDLGRDVLAKQLDAAEESWHRTAGGEDDEDDPPKPSQRSGTKRRGKLSVEEQNLEIRVLRHLAEGEPIKVSKLRTATAATLPVLVGLARKKWIARETSAVERDARRTERFAVLVDEARLPKLTQNQEAILAELAAAGGELPLAELRKKEISSSTLQTLVRRGLVRIDERMATFRLGGLRPSTEVFNLNAQQMDALAGIVTSLGKFKPFLLYGITGSGKTAVYLEAMKRALERGMSSILLVPEIGLTPQTVGLLDAAFGQNVALLHSALTPEERSEQWRRIRRGEARIVVGTRSAIFAPAQNLGLILVDEEHDQSYKQEETPRYNARDVAVMRAKLAAAVVVMGSATPSLESWQNSLQSKYERIEIRDRVMNRPLPEVELLDMRREFKESGREDLFSRSLVEQTKTALDRGEQVLILLNRRGYSFAVFCRACGVKLECDNCAIALTHHKAMDGAEIAREGQRLECHYCGMRKTVPPRCPKCDSEHLYYLGAGSQQGEERLSEIFPTARIGRMDRDTVRGRYDLERLLARLHAGEINLLVGTQMIAKGHDIHGVTLVGVVGCDHALSMPDFRAAERVFQLMTQVSGRAGRGDLPGRVVVQTYYPDHYAILAATTHDYQSFAERELKYRRWMHYPPFGVLANVLVQSPKLEEAAGWSSTLGKFLIQSQTSGAVRVLGPCTAPIARIKGVYRFHLILKATTRKALNEALKCMLAYADQAGVPRRNLVVDVDALRLM